MKAKTVFIQITSSYQHFNPLASAIKKIVELAGGSVVEQLVDGTVEADVAVTTSVDTALHLMKESERALIVLAWLNAQTKDACVSLAARYPQRITAISFLGNGTNAFAPFLMKLVASSEEIA
jgi:hypothetical protein